MYLALLLLLCPHPALPPLPYAPPPTHRGICGKDLNKRGTPAGDTPIPESVGLAPAAVFLLAVITFELIHYYDINSLVEWVSAGFRGPLHLQVRGCGGHVLGWGVRVRVEVCVTEGGKGLRAGFRGVSLQLGLGQRHAAVGASCSSSSSSPGVHRAFWGVSSRACTR